MLDNEASAYETSADKFKEVYEESNQVRRVRRQIGNFDLKPFMRLFGGMANNRNGEGGSNLFSNFGRQMSRPMQADPAVSGVMHSVQDNFKRFIKIFPRRLFQGMN